MENSTENRMEINEDVAEAKKNEGNTSYKNGDYEAAIRLYTEAIDICPDCASYYNNRAAAFIMQDKYQQGLEDVQRALTLDNTLVKGYLREAKCHLALGSADAAIRSLNHVADFEPQNKQAQSELRAAKLVQHHDQDGHKAFEAGDFRKVVYNMDRAIDHSPACTKFKVKRAEALAKMRRITEASQAINAVLMREPRNADAIYVRGLCLYYQDNMDKAIQHFQQTLKLAPDHSPARIAFKKCKLLKSKKEEGNEMFKRGNYQEAYGLYTEALQVDPLNVNTNAKLYCNRATVCSKLNKPDQGILDCNKALELDPDYLKAFMRRAKCYMETEQYEEAVRDYEKVCQMDRSRENKALLQEANLELKKSKRKDYYKILNISKNATEVEIKKAYKKHALLHHPDRHSNKTEEVQKAEEVKFKEVGEAYNVLSDSKKKMRYDSGQDLDDLEGFGDFDPTDIFSSLFTECDSEFSFWV
ncbi:dnaJ homolog subfamily C member 7-like isoform X2 [Acanthaster planci]|uniref:DnaJ homolog subfamily C member 7-like isoform X2 n=1 Tax=Acanthaster planci TaxID=133434 RepID=A0A8B7ZJT6_ACAPL|nr:dnaJ homolog subfamily C member 7-like isoform X2 [Acanthaster planci]